MNITSEELLKEARALEPQLQQWRRTLHRHPEVGFDLPHTKELVKKALTEMFLTFFKRNENKQHKNR